MSFQFVLAIKGATSIQLVTIMCCIYEVDFEMGCMLQSVCNMVVRRVKEQEEQEEEEEENINEIFV